MNATVEKANEVISKFLHQYRQIERLKKTERRALLRRLCDGYASANFGYEDKDDNYTLDEADLLKHLADFVCKTLGISAFDHYALEEIYQHPVGKDETPEQRAKALETRNYKQVAIGTIQTAHAAHVLAVEITNFYVSGKKLGFWLDVVKVLKTKIDKDLARG